MVKRVFALLVFPVLLWPASARASSDRIAKETLVSQGKKRAYYLFAPSSVKTSTSVPLILTLHGSGRNGLSLVEKWKDLASTEGIIIAGPDALVGVAGAVNRLIAEGNLLAPTAPVRNPAGAATPRPTASAFMSPAPIAGVRTAC